MSTAYNTAQANELRWLLFQEQRDLFSREKFCSFSLKGWNITTNVTVHHILPRALDGLNIVSNCILLDSVLHDRIHYEAPKPHEVATVTSQVCLDYFNSHWRHWNAVYIARDYTVTDALESLYVSKGLISMTPCVYLD